MASAHLPPGELFFAAQFPDNLVPTIDGEHSDWDILPESPYSIFNDRLFDPAQFQEAARGEVDISDANIRHRFGWNENSNMIYLASQISTISTTLTAPLGIVTASMTTGK